MDVVTLPLGVDEHNDLLVADLGDLILKPERGTEGSMLSDQGMAYCLIDTAMR